jgi:release factor glutamine methyltransferase
LSFLDIRTAIAQGTRLLSSADIPEPRFTAELLLCHALRCERVHLFAHPEQELRELEWLHYGRYLDQRMRGKPLQYITHKQEFFGREFRVTRDVLIPRPETELLAETVLKMNRAGGELAIDVGTGSGAIAATLALDSGLRLVGTDISVPALQVARSNAERLQARVQFAAGDLLAPFSDESADLVLCNPPYVPEVDHASLQREVRDWEPALALFGGEDGTDFYKRLIPQSARVLKRGGVLAMEIGFGQATAVSQLADGWRHVRLIPDLAGIPRVLVCEKP